MEYKYTLVIIIVLGVFGFFFTYPQYQLKTSLDKNIDFLNFTIENNQNYIKSLNEIDKQLSEEPELRKIDIALPSAEPISETFRFLEEQAKNNGIIISDINFSVEEQAKSFSEGEFYNDGQANSSMSETVATGQQNSNEEIVFSPPDFTEFGDTGQNNISRIISRNFKLGETSITFKANGSYQAIKNFITSLEGSIRLIRIEDFNLKEIEINEKDKETNLLEAIISLKVYNYTKVIR